VQKGRRPPILLGKPGGHSSLQELAAYALSRLEHVSDARGYLRTRRSRDECIGAFLSTPTISYWCRIRVLLEETLKGSWQDICTIVGADYDGNIAWRRASLHEAKSDPVFLGHRR
jgi:hypothetical protein